MAKSKTLLLSLGAKGTIGNALTCQKRGQTTIARKKPIPAYRYTLPQAYQRWLYEDYAYLWTQQSEATKRQYAATGSRFHLTGFQYWMKYNLTNLPDIAGMWHLDEKSGAIAYDSSKQRNNGAIIGASPTTGLIDGAYSFDGLNDTINCGNKPSLNLTTLLTLEGLIHLTDDTLISSKFLSKKLAYEFSMHAATMKLRMTIYTPGGKIDQYGTKVLVKDQWYHVVFTYNTITAHLYIDAIEDTLNAYGIQTYGTINTVADNLYLGSRDATANWFPGYQDNFILYKRILDHTTIERHSERRYPP